MYMLCCLPFIFIRGEDFIVLIVTPLIAIMKKQVRKKVTVEYGMNDVHLV